MPVLTVIAIIAACAAAMLYCAHGRRRLRVLSAWKHPTPGFCFYLDEDAAMDIYLARDYPYLQREVERRTHRNIVLALLSRLSPIHVGVRYGQQEITKYFEDAGPITVIGRIIRALDKENDIVYVNLIDRTIAPTAGLRRALEPPNGDRVEQTDRARLRDLEAAAFVSVEGRFWVTAKSEKSTTFTVPYGDPNRPSSDQPKVSVTCVTEQVRGQDVPEHAFRARCLGKISRNPDTGDLTISPVLAIFR